MAAGRRITFWLPKRDYWVLDVVERLRRASESRGLPMSQGDVLREAVTGGLAAVRRAEDGERATEPEPLPKRDSGARLTIHVRKEFEGVLRVVQRIVDTKKKLGHETSISYELLRLASNGLKREMVGADIDRCVLEMLRKEGLDGSEHTD